MERPNILVFLTDDHAQWALGSSGNPDIESPNLDYLAATGAVMENAFTPTPVCSPARANFLTGATSSQHGVHDYLDGAPEHFDRDWLAGRATLPELLRASGYHTGFVGKWHLGNDSIPQHGFDHWHALAGDYPIDAAGPARYSRNGVIQGATGSKASTITDHAVEFLREQDREHPFFLLVCHVSTHSPWEGHPERLVARYRECAFSTIPKGETYPFGIQNLESRDLIDRTNETAALAQYYASVTAIDESVGRVLDTLDATGARENTLVVYASDHGLNCGHHGIWGKGNGTLPLNMVDESIRIPMILNHRATIAPGQRRQEFVDHLDLFQAVLHAAGLSPPTGVEYAGRSLLALCTNEARSDWRDAQFSEYGPVQMIRTIRYKLIRRHGYGPDQLFDLDSDPREMTDRISDPNLHGVLADLLARLERYFQRYSTAATSGTRPGGPELTNSSAPWAGAMCHLP